MFSKIRNKFSNTEFFTGVLRVHDNDDLQHEQSINSTINKGLTVLNAIFGQK